MRKLLSILLIAQTLTMAYGQIDHSLDAEKKKIAAVKKNNSYIGAEMTHQNADTALLLAHEMLQIKIDNWVKSQKKFNGAAKTVAINTQYSTEKITMPRANMYRAFVYVKKTDILPASNVNVSDRLVTQVEKISENENTRAEDANRATVVKRLLDVQNTGQLKVVLNELKKSGKISEFANLSGLKGKNQAEYIMVVFNQEGLVEAVLSEGETRTNLSSATDDQLSNYKGRGAIGIKVIPAK